MPQRASRPLMGRGTRLNPTGRFEALAYEADPEVDGQAHGEAGDPPAPTRYYRDATRTLIATNDSPDVGFDASINPYRGCSHGCAYCYARPTHELLGLSAGLDLEAQVFVKHEAPALLRHELAAPSWRPQVLGISGVTDAYQQIERSLRITRRCLEVLAEARNPCIVVTKSRLVARDADLLAELARYEAAAVVLSVTTLDGDLARRMEPRASSPRRRLEAIELLACAGVPTGVMTAPVIPGLNDHELPALLSAAADHGAGFAGYTLLRLPHGVRDLFATWLDDHYPERRERVLGRVRDTRRGKLNEGRFGERMRGTGPYAEHVRGLFDVCRRRHGLTRTPRLSVASFRRPAPQGQLRLLDA